MKRLFILYILAGGLLFTSAAQAAPLSQAASIEVVNEDGGDKGKYKKKKKRNKRTCMKAKGCKPKGKHLSKKACD